MDAPASATSSGTWPDEIGGYEVIAILAPETVLAVAPGNRRVVLKLLDEDCLLRGGAKPKLHPGIRDRLARVRELAHAHVANLHGVEHDAERVYLVWEFVDGVPLEEWGCGASGPVAAKELLLMARELILTAEALHARGIVHGAIHGRNVIIDNAGRVKLVHVSPLLYTEARHDVESIAALFRELAERHGEARRSLEALARDADESDGSLRSIGSRAASMIELRRDEEADDVERQTNRRADRRRRSASRLAAAAVVVLALALSYGMKQYVRRITPHPPAPPEAPAAAME